MISLVLGGARSGKSGFAEGLVAKLAAQGARIDAPTDISYVATARPWPDDREFATRIAKHRATRPADWLTEDARDAVDVLREPARPHLIIDDLGTWLTEQYSALDAWPDQPGGRDRHALVTGRCATLLAALRNTPAEHVVLVSPEVGMGIIPENPVGRVFRDDLGALNAAVAEVADTVHLLVAGCTLTLKS